MCGSCGCGEEKKESTEEQGQDKEESEEKTEEAGE